MESLKMLNGMHNSYRLTSTKSNQFSQVSSYKKIGSKWKS
jgi:hypothetical protein